jgi:hypothetical protein
MTSVNQVVNECLRVCCESGAENVKAFLAGLRASGWPEDDVMAVEQGVSRALLETAHEPL